MNLQIIKSIHGKAEYVLLPISAYKTLQKEIEAELKHEIEGEYVPFDPADYIENPIALARIKAQVTQKALAKLMGVTQAYISKVEQQKTVTSRLLSKVYAVLENALPYRLNT